jgi:hypothetical protein
VAERLSDLYDRMRIQTRSPDRSVTLTATGRGQITVALAEGITKVHTVESLERQLDAVVRVAIVAFQQGSYRAVQMALGRDPDTPEKR